MVSQTPIKCFVRLDSLFFTEDWTGTRVPIALATGDGQAEFLAWTLERAHGVPVKPWDYTDPPAPERTPVQLTTACDGECGDPSYHDAHLTPGALEYLSRPRSKSDPHNTAKGLGAEFIDHSPGCLGGRGEVSKTCPVCTAERDMLERNSFPQHIDRDGNGHWPQAPLVNLEALEHAECTSKDCPVCRSLLDGAGQEANGEASR